MGQYRDLGGAYQYSFNDGIGSDDGTQYEKVGPRQHFKNQAEMVAAMRNPAYKKSESYRQVVRQIIAQSDPVALGMAEAPSDDRHEYGQQKMDMVREMFKDPRYKTDARYRAQVAAMCASPEADEFFPELSQSAVDRQQQRVRGLKYEEPMKEITGAVNPNAKRDQNGDLK